MPIFLTKEQIQVLKQTHRTIKDKKLADRIKAVLMLNHGFTARQVSTALLLDEVTIYRYLKQYKEKGINGLLECHYIGGQTRLTSSQEQELKTFLKINTQRTAKEIVKHIHKIYQINFSLIGATKLLHRLGFAYKKPKVIPGKADRVKQEEFLKQYQAIKAKLKSSDQVYFLDSTHPQHNTKPSYGWILKGKANDKFIKTNTGRDRLNLNGALSLNDKTAIVLEEKAINKETTINLLEAIKKQQKNGKVYLILDNASYHHAWTVTSWMLHHPRFKLIFLPTYSPNLNLIERLWRFFHQKVTWNHYFATFTEFRTASLKFFQNIKIYENELKTLLTDNFQLIPA